MLLALIAVFGIVILWWEQRQNRKNRMILQEAERSICDSDLECDTKKERLFTLYHQNGFELLWLDSTHLQISKKQFSLGWLLLSTSLFLVGAALYLIIYRFSHPKTRVITPCPQ